jgi:cytochrome c biogenesis protein CcmG/thiol:disulfide interchange protein DsbE
MRMLVGIAVGVVVLTLTTVAMEGNLSSIAQSAQPQRLAEFTLPRVRVPERELTSDRLAGHVTLINVWASWCVPCRREHGMLMEIARESSVPIYGLNYRDKRDDAIRWLETLGDPYAASGFDAAGKVAEDMEVYGTPETYLVDAHGAIAYRHLGPITEDVWRNTLRPLVARLGEDAK